MNFLVTSTWWRISSYMHALSPAVTHHEYIEVNISNVLNATYLDLTAAIGAEVVKVLQKTTITSSSLELCACCCYPDMWLLCCRLCVL